MLVYGDAKRNATAETVRSAVAEGLAALRDLEPGLARHSALVSVFLLAGELVQGIADSERATIGADARSPRQDAGARVLLAIARALDHSWRDGFCKAAAPDVAADLAMLGGADMLSLTRPEGYGLYALYPEGYLEAARRAGLGSDTVVIGIRSIGVSLAALVAAAIDAAPAISLRPVGHPFCRHVEAVSLLREEVAADDGRHFAVVDEGPGLSGSSFASVAAWLEAAGVARDKVVFFPSHEGAPGNQASAEVEASWLNRRRLTVGFNELLLNSDDPSHRLQTWIEALVGPLDSPLEDVGGGRWREHLQGGRDAWPPFDPRFERRKFLARSGGSAFLVKFAGLGEDGLRKLRTAEELAQAGFTAEPIGLCHGFLVERWLDAAPLNAANVNRNVLVDRIAAYLGFRAKHLAPPAAGASLSHLAEMAGYNTERALGADAAAAVREAVGSIQRMEADVRRVDTDNRLHAWEWLIRPDGTLLKTDALDHSTGHDLIGCQDIAWDIAGAVAEFNLAPVEKARLLAGVEALTGRPVAPCLAEALHPCYLAFQLGLWTMAAETGDLHGAEQARERYKSQLVHWLEASSKQTPPLI